MLRTWTDPTDQPEILADVNLECDGEKYADKEAATEMQGDPNK